MTDDTTMSFQIDPELQKAFQAAAERSGTSASQLIGDLMRQYVAQSEIAI